MTPHRLWSLALIIAVVCGLAVLGTPAPVAGVTPLQTCTSQNIRGFPVAGDVCGGSTHGLLCTPGALYRCQSGPLGQTNNCTLSQACPVGCLTGPTTGTLADTCFSGSPPLTLSTSNTPGGNDVTLTAVLAAIHPNGAIVNLTIDRGDLVPGSYCAVPDLAAGATSVSFALPTAVVSASTDVHMYVDIAYTDAAGVSRQLVSVPSTLTLAPGGTAPPPPPLASFTLTPSTIAPGQSSFMDVVLSKMAPAQGVNISVSSSNPAVASVIPNGQPTVLGGCTTGGGAATVAAANSVPQQTTVTISASSGDPSQTVLTHPLTVTGGCQPKTCLEASTLSCGASCGSLPDGCGGTLLCGCDNCAGGTCGGGGTPNVCGVPPTSGVSALTLSPTSVMGGTSATGTVTLASPAPAGGAGVFLSSSNASASVPPSVVVQGGQTSASFTITTSAVSATTSAVITAQYSGSATATLTITTGATCTPTTCAAQGKNCGTISDGCGGTLTCGTCTSPQTCGGGGVANVCGSGTASTAQLTLSATGRSGESVSSSPAGLTVNVGTTGSASFATGTLVTLTVSNGRDAVWSGGCSSGGDTQKSCSLTLNAATSVTANVQ